MAKDTITLTLDGNVTIDLFKKSVVEFVDLVQALSEEIVGADKIEWQIFRMEAGSATTGIRGFYVEETEVQRVVQAYGEVGRALAENRPVPYSESVVRHATSLVSVLNGHIKAVKFKTDDLEASVVEPVSEERAGSKRYSLGIIAGVVSTISNTPLRLSLVDPIFSKVVYCYLEQEQRDLAREVWDKRVSVTGMISRDPDTGRPIDVREVKDVKILTDTTSRSYKQAKGIFGWQEGDEPAEVSIRRVRDAS